MNRIWKRIVAIYVFPGVPHPIWREPIGQQRNGESTSCLGYLRALRAIEKRQYADLSSIGFYEFSEVDDLWVFSTSIDSFADSTEAASRRSWSWCPPSLLGSVEVLDPGGPPWTTQVKDGVRVSCEFYL